MRALAPTNTHGSHDLSLLLGQEPSQQQFVASAAVKLGRLLESRQKIPLLPLLSLGQLLEPPEIKVAQITEVEALSRQGLILEGTAIIRHASICQARPPQFTAKQIPTRMQFDLRWTHRAPASTALPEMGQFARQANLRAVFYDHR